MKVWVSAMPKKVNLVKWECKYCQTQYGYKVFALNCESTCKAQRNLETLNKAIDQELEDKYFPKCGSACGRCQEKAISKAGYFLNLCDDCFGKEMSQLGDNLACKEYQQAFASVLARAILGKRS